MADTWSPRVLVIDTFAGGAGGVQVADEVAPGVIVTRESVHWRDGELWIPKGEKLVRPPAGRIVEYDIVAVVEPSPRLS